MSDMKSRACLGVVSALSVLLSLSVQANYPSATYSLTCDGDVATSSSILGGSALSITQGLPTAADYISVRDSVGGKAFVGSDSVQPWSEGLDVFQPGCWSMLIVARGAEIVNGVYWDVGWCAWQDTNPSGWCTGFSLIRNADGETALVRRQKGASPQTILSAKVANDTTQFHAYVVTHNPSTPSFVLYVDGKKVAESTTLYQVWRNGYQFCGVYGGSPNAKLANGTRFAIDEIGIWQTELSASEVAEICRNYPVWPSLTRHEARMDGDALYSGLSWTPPIENPATAVGRITAAPDVNLTFDSALSMYALEIQDDGDFGMSMGPDGSIANVGTFNLTGVAGDVRLDWTTFPVVDSCLFANDAVVRVVGESPVEVPSMNGNFAWINKAEQRLEIAAPLTFPLVDDVQRLGIGNAEGQQNIVFNTGTEVDADQLRLGSYNSASVKLVQRGGSVKLNNAGLALQISERPLSDSSYTLLGGTLDVSSGYVRLGMNNGGVSGGLNAVLSVGGGTESAEMNVYGIQTFYGVTGNQLVELKSNGILTVGAGGIRLDGAGGRMTLEGGRLNVVSTTTLAIYGGISVTNTVEINVAEGTVLTLDAALEGDGTITKTGLGTLILSVESPAFVGAIDVREGTLGLADPVEIGTATLSFAQSTQLALLVKPVRLIKGGSVEIDLSCLAEGSEQPPFSVIGPDGRTVLADGVDYKLTTSGAKKSVAFVPRADGVAAWMDYTFTLNEFAGHKVDSRNIVNAGFAGPTEYLLMDGGWTGLTGYDTATGQLLLKTTPCRDMLNDFAWPYAWTVSLVSQVPAVPDVCLLGIGSTYFTSCRYLALVTGSSPDKLRLVCGGGYNPPEELLEMTIPFDASNSQRLFALACSGTTCIVYYGDDTKKDVMEIGTCELPFADFGGGFQVGSIHGGVGGTGLRRVNEVDEADGCEFRAVRIFNLALDAADLKLMRDGLIARRGMSILVR